MDIWPGWLDEDRRQGQATATARESERKGEGEEERRAEASWNNEKQSRTGKRFAKLHYLIILFATISPSPSHPFY